MSENRGGVRGRQIGSVVFVGMVESGMYAVNWGLLSRIFISWVVTVPAAALLAALFFGALQGVHVDAQGSIARRSN